MAGSGVTSQTACDRLRHEDPIERVAVQRGQFTGSVEMVELERLNRRAGAGTQPRPALADRRRCLSTRGAIG